VPIIAVDGTNDPVQRYDGFLYPPSSPPVPRLLSVPETLAFWWQSHGCTGENVKALPHLNAGDPTRIVQYEWTGCTKGGAVKLYRVNSGGHIPPSFSQEAYDKSRFGVRSRDMETAAVIWEDLIANR
jgi:poly(3-hydroxybutyrate) depolymerase